MPERGKHRRLGFLEHEDGPIPEELTDESKISNEPPPDYIDFKGKPIDPFISIAVNCDGATSQMETRGETAARVLKRILWMVVRIAIGSLFFWYILRGSQCAYIEFV